MGKVTILPETTKNPISLIGFCAGVCWGADVTDPQKNYKRGIDCIQNNHGRTIEYPDIYAVIDGYSARVIREWYTHIGGAPTRLQASTRYIDYDDFKYITPDSITNQQEALQIYSDAMKTISNAMQRLRQLGIPNEDVSMLLPLGMETKMVDKRNARNLADMSRQRLCQRTNWEFRRLLKKYLKELANYSSEWNVLIKLLMRPKCVELGRCPEKKSCGRFSISNRKKTWQQLGYSDQESDFLEEAMETYQKAQKDFAAADLNKMINGFKAVEDEE